MYGTLCGIRSHDKHNISIFSVLNLNTMSILRELADFIYIYTASYMDLSHFQEITFVSFNIIGQNERVLCCLGVIHYNMTKSDNNCPWDFSKISAFLQSQRVILSVITSCYKDDLWYGKKNSICLCWHCSLSSSDCSHRMQKN